jgi:cell wall-associated NlpC family hydrolase
MASFLSPGMSAAQSSTLMGSIYNPTESLRLEMMGITPGMKPGQPGKTNSLTQVMSSIISHLTNGGKATTAQIAASMQPGQGMNYAVSALGLNPQQVAPMLEAVNTLQGHGLTDSRIQQLFNQAESGGPHHQEALNELKKYGVDQSEIAQIQAANAPKYAQLADQSEAFASGVAQATGAIGKLNTAIARLMKASGADTVVGYTAGAASAATSGISALASGNISGAVNEFKATASQGISAVTNLIGGGAAAAKKPEPPVKIPASPKKDVAVVHPPGTGLLADAEHYGHIAYVWGGGKPHPGWDCSGMINYLLGHDYHMTLPDNTHWDNATQGYSGGMAGPHGPVVSDYLSWSGAKTIPKGQAQPGDLVIYPGVHIGLYVSPTTFYSAQSPQLGTGLNDINWRPWIVRHVTGMPSGGSPVGGSPGTSTTSTTIAGLVGMGLGLGDKENEGSVSELTAVAEALSGSAFGATADVLASSTTTTPGTPGSPKKPSPGGPVGAGLNALLTGILSGISAPASKANLATMVHWSTVDEGFRYPGGHDRGGMYNPLNTTEDEPGDSIYNSDGVKNYPNPTVGAHANAATLLNGRYPAIVKQLQAGGGLMGTGPWNAELLTWSDGGYSTAAAGGHFKKSQQVVVGERGPELVEAGSPHFDTMITSMLHKAYHSLVGIKDSSPKASLELGADSITIKTSDGNTLANGDPQAQALIKAYVEALAEEDIYGMVMNA